MLKIGIFRNPTHAWGIIAEGGIKWGKVGHHSRVGQFGNYVLGKDFCYVNNLLNIWRSIIKKLEKYPD